MSDDIAPVTGDTYVAPRPQPGPQPAPAPASSDGIAPITGSTETASRPPAPQPPPPQLSPQDQLRVELMGELIRRAALRGVSWIKLLGDPQWSGASGTKIHDLTERYLTAKPEERPGIIFEIEKAQVGREIELSEADLPRVVAAEDVHPDPLVQIERDEQERRKRLEAYGEAWEAFIALLGLGAAATPLRGETYEEIELNLRNAPQEPVFSGADPLRPQEARPDPVPVEPARAEVTEALTREEIIRDGRGIRLSRGSFREAIRRYYRVERGITDRRHTVADGLTRRILEVIANSVDDPIRVINNALIARGDPPYQGSDVYEAVRKLQLNIFNDPRNLRVGGSAENQQLGRDMAGEIRETGHINILGESAIDLPEDQRDGGERSGGDRQPERSR